VLNNLRSRVALETDGQLKTGRDVASPRCWAPRSLASPPPAGELGCIMMRVCHLDTCPAGVATQNPELRKHFAGQPEDVENFMYFIAEELREIMAQARLPHAQRDGRARGQAGAAQGDQPLESAGLDLSRCSGSRK
jgi:glutamate synthase (NADPH/NADH) large chain